MNLQAPPVSPAAVLRFPKSLALIAGLASATGFAPLNFWPVSLLCVALVMQLVHAAPDLKGALLRGYWFGVGHFVVGLNWIAGSFAYQDAMPVWLGWIAVLVLALYIAIYPALAAGLAWRHGRAQDTVFVLFFAAAWIVTEWLRATMFTGFAWNPLGVIWVGASGVTRLLGTYALSGFVVLGAGTLWLLASRNIKGAVVPAALLVAGLLPSVPMSIPEPDLNLRMAKQPLIRVVQPNIGQQDKHVPAFDAINFRKLEAMTGAPGTMPRLIVWPEAAIPDYIQEEPWARARLATLLGPKDALLTGGVALEYDRAGKLVGARNSVFALLANGQITSRYDKSHLVPYGEYLPMRPVLSAIGLSRLVPGDIDFWPGPGPRSFDVPGFGKVGFQICYEVIFSGQVVERANRPAFIFNPSNDAWFGSWGPPQHLAQARLRAVEEGLPVVRSTPTGISAIVDADGRVLHSVPYHEAGFIEARLPFAHPPTLFARLGNILPLGFTIVLVLTGIALRRRLR